MKTYILTFLGVTVGMTFLWPLTPYLMLFSKDSTQRHSAMNTLMAPEPPSFSDEMVKGFLIGLIMATIVTIIIVISRNEDRES